MDAAWPMHKVAIGDFMNCMVSYRHARRHHPARRVDVHGDIFLGVLQFAVQQLHADRCRHRILDRPVTKMMRSFRAVMQIVAALAQFGLLDHMGQKVPVVRVDTGSDM